MAKVLAFLLCSSCLVQAEPLTEADIRSLIEPDIVLPTQYPYPPYPPPGAMMPAPRRPPYGNDCRGQLCLDAFHAWGGRPVAPPSPYMGYCRDERTGRIVPCGR